MVLLGTWTPRLDDKGRLTLPAKFRDDLAGGLVITKGLERCLFVFPAAEFLRISGALRQAPLTNKDARDFARVFFASASDERLDAQGRVGIPAALRTYAGLDKDCVVIGNFDRAEVWDAATWEAYSARAEESFANRSEEVVPGLF